MSSKRKSPPIKIASEDFLFPTKRMALDSKNDVDLDMERSNMSDVSSENSDTLKDSVSRPLFNSHLPNFRFVAFIKFKPRIIYLC